MITNRIIVDGSYGVGTGRLQELVEGDLEHKSDIRRDPTRGIEAMAAHGTLLSGTPGVERNKKGRFTPLPKTEYFDISSLVAGEIAFEHLVDADYMGDLNPEKLLLALEDAMYVPITPGAVIEYLVNILEGVPMLDNLGVEVQEVHKVAYSLVNYFLLDSMEFEEGETVIDALKRGSIEALEEGIANSEMSAIMAAHTKFNIEYVNMAFGSHLAGLIETRIDLKYPTNEDLNNAVLKEREALETKGSAEIYK